jgi:hypothetical protein
VNSPAQHVGTTGRPNKAIAKANLVCMTICVDHLSCYFSQRDCVPTAMLRLEAFCDGWYERCHQSRPQLPADLRRDTSQHVTMHFVVEGVLLGEAGHGPCGATVARDVGQTLFNTPCIPCCVLCLSENRISQHTLSHRSGNPSSATRSSGQGAAIRKLSMTVKAKRETCANVQV